jgi:hypothetical protein
MEVEKPSAKSGKKLKFFILPADKVNGVLSLLDRSVRGSPGNQKGSIPAQARMPVMTIKEDDYDHQP